MKLSLLYLVFFTFLSIFTCGSPDSSKRFNVSDCGVEYVSPYLEDNLIFDSDMKLTLAIRFINVLNTRDSSLNVNVKELSSYIENLNKAFIDANVQFKLTEIDTIYQEFNSIRDFKQDILRYKRNNLHKLPAIDIFIYPIDLDYYPGIALAIKSDGAAIQSLYISSNTLVHELGHCLGLSHTHQGDGNGYTKGDFICDTPNLYISDLIDGNCNYSHKPSGVTDEEMRIIIHNYMSYVNKRCRKEFTKDQIDKMRFNLAKEPMLRNVLIF